MGHPLLQGWTSGFILGQLEYSFPTNYDTVQYTRYVKKIVSNITKSSLVEVIVEVI